MGNYEDRVKALAKLYKNGSLKARVLGAKGLPKALKLYYAAHFDARTDWRNYHKVQRLAAACGPEWRGLSAKKRRAVIDVLLPELAEDVTGALAVVARSPYQMHHARRPFRCPRSPEQQASMEIAWLIQATHELGDYPLRLEAVIDHADSFSFRTLAPLIAGALDGGGERAAGILDTFSAVAAGEHGSTSMSRQLIAGCLCSELEGAWDFVVRLLRAAQRQEGLRQAILESVDEAHPGAFDRLLTMIREENLTRFTSVVRAVDVWFGFQLEQGKAREAMAVIERIQLLLQDDGERLAGIESDSPDDVYLALWATAYHDVDLAMERAALVFERADEEHRFAALTLIRHAGWSGGGETVLKALDDPDMRVAALALGGVGIPEDDGARQGALESLRRLFERIDSKKKSVVLAPLVWPWSGRELHRRDIASRMVAMMDQEALVESLHLVRELDPYDRERILRGLTGLSDRWEQARAKKKPEPLEPPLHGVVLEFLGDPSADVRQTALQALEATPVVREEVERHVELLRRKSSDVRTAALGRLAKLPDRSLVEVATELCEAGVKERRVAGLELARNALIDGRCAEECRSLAAAYRERRRAISELEQSHLDVLSGASEQGEVTRDDALGLIDPADLKPWPAPGEGREVELTDAARACLEAVCERVIPLAEKEHAAAVESHGGHDLHMQLPEIHEPWSCSDSEDITAAESEWKEWSESRGAEMRDPDGLEWVRVLTATYDLEDVGPWARKVHAFGSSYGWNRVWDYAKRMIEWCLFWEQPEGFFDLQLDVAEARLAALTPEERELVRRADDVHLYRFRFGFGEDVVDDALAPQMAAMGKLNRFGDALFDAGRFALSARWSPPQESVRRWFGLLAHANSLSLPHSSCELSLAEFLTGVNCGAFDGTDHVTEFLARIAGPLLQGQHFGLGNVTRPSSIPRASYWHWKGEGDPLERFPELMGARDRAVQRVLEVEFARGDLETAATPLVSGLGALEGLDVFGRAVDALGKLPLERMASYSYGSHTSRKATLSSIIVATEPRVDEDQTAFTAWAQGVPEKRLLELAAYVPNWAPHIEAAMGWRGLTDAVWWLHAHTKEVEWTPDRLSERRMAAVSERTPLTSEELAEGAVDVAWFLAARKALTASRWDKLFDCAKYASSSGGHKRAELFSSAMTKAVKAPELIKRIDAKRHQDSVRALGLVPLRGGKLREKDLLQRYERLARFRKESKKFGSQRQASEGRAVEIGMQNLARTAGYRDPQRLTWAMEQEAVKDLAEGPVTIERGDVVVSLSVTEDGLPEFSVRRGERALKNVPKALAKDPGVAALKVRAKELRTQASRVGQVLEASMVRRDTFEGHELASLVKHPILGPGFARIVFRAVGAKAMGYLDAEGTALRTWKGGRAKFDPAGEYVIAHPCDFLELGEWHGWQAECFDAARTQPLKQIFRELYPLSAAERKNGKHSERYAGHQVNPKQAMALLGGRGWVLRPEEGVSKTHFQEGLVARLHFEESFYTPADIEGLTLDRLHFTRRGDWKPVKLEEVPPHVFSEAMRDLDLVVSVAHQGGVDPEASASTVEMRAALLREACRLLKVDNVEVKERNAIIRGERATYSLHLGSAEVRVVGSVTLFIVAVHSQHRGRIFLPFADSDPRTAEVMSKALMLARDKEIQDPNILEQIAAS